MPWMIVHCQSTNMNRWVVAPTLSISSVDANSTIVCLTYSTTGLHSPTTPHMWLLNQPRSRCVHSGSTKPHRAAANGFTAAFICATFLRG
jgi:hypothetical protein